MKTHLQLSCCIHLTVGVRMQDELLVSWCSVLLIRCVQCHRLLFECLLHAPVGSSAWIPSPGGGGDQGGFTVLTATE